MSDKRLRTGRGAVVATVLACAVVAILTGCGATGDGSATSSPVSASTTPTAPAPSATASLSPTTTAGETGFDTEAIYAACDAAVPSDIWGNSPRLLPGPIVADSVGLASADGYTEAHTNGDPNAVYVNVQYFDGGTFAFSALCVASGDPAAPRIEYIRTLD
jgi:hypothetical protein